MTQALPLDILDLRHFSAAELQPLLLAEAKEWDERLNWDYRTSTDLILHYLESRVLPGYVAVDHSKAVGYVFCVYEEAKAVIGDIFSTGTLDKRFSGLDVERRLLEHLIEMLQNSPGTERIEAQLLLHPAGWLGGVFRAAGFEIFRRHFMQLALTGYERRLTQDHPAEKLMRTWNEEDFTPAAHLIAHAYAGHLDSRINDQYQSLAGSMRFLHNIIRFPGCGRFDAAASRVLVESKTGEIKGVLLCSEVKTGVAHITQVCVAPEWQGRGLGAMMIEDCATYLCRRHFRAVTLTVTQQNHGAVRLYDQIGFTRRHAFDAVLWVRPPLQLAHLRTQMGMR